jgi:hypothetical protein
LEVPQTVVTTTFAVPTAPGGVIAVTDVSLAEVMAAETPPTWTRGLVRFVPEIVMVVPPENSPEPGEIALMVGGGRTSLEQH